MDEVVVGEASAEVRNWLPCSVCGGPAEGPWCEVCVDA